ncbi:MAG: acetyl-CoA C-acyltransferase [Proteobacteria bacterium]|nr:acetyl-CoA C-acyltransferase [Pseudomonadota bacterium]
MNSDPVVIVAAKRTPSGNFNGVFVNTPAPKLAAAAISKAIADGSIPAESVDAVYMGCVLPAGIGQAPARQAALAAGIPISTPCTTINKMCGSGMQTVIMAHDALLAGSRRLIAAGGMENMSLAPYLLPGARQGYRLGQQTVYDHMLLDGLEDAYQRGKHMGFFAELCAEKYHISRSEQDDYAGTSIARARLAIQSGWFQDELAPVQITRKKQPPEWVSQDEGPFSVQPEKISQLAPVFKENGSITAANASSIADGAAVLLLTRASTANQMGLKPLATIINHYSYAHEPAWYSTAPIGAIEGLLKITGWSIDKVDLFEINEAFAVVTLVAIQQLQLDHNKVNVNGGGCILGHPIGATGARILVTLIHALRQRNLKRGIAALCIGGGEATAIAIEV